MAVRYSPCTGYMKYMYVCIYVCMCLRMLDFLCRPSMVEMLSRKLYAVRNLNLPPHSGPSYASVYQTGDYSDSDFIPMIAGAVQVHSGVLAPDLKDSGLHPSACQCQCLYVSSSDESDMPQILERRPPYDWPSNEARKQKF